MARKLIYIIGGVVVVLLLVAVLLPFVIDANRFRPEIESSLNTALNRKVDIGNIRLSILSGGVAVENISISDDPSYGPIPESQIPERESGTASSDLLARHPCHRFDHRPTQCDAASLSGWGMELLHARSQPDPKQECHRGEA